MRGHIGLLLAVCGLLLLGVLPAQAEETTPPQKGTITGILVAKGPSWIEVRADGAEKAERYLPYWRGGTPDQGGGYDAAMVATIKKLIVPNRVRLTWEMQEHPRIVSVEMLVPDTKEGTLTGTVTAKGEGWIEVKAEKDGPVERYTPRWIGGLPKDGGGLDKAMLATFASIKVGERISLTWRYDERKRAVTITPAPAE